MSVVVSPAFKFKALLAPPKEKSLKSIMMGEAPILYALAEWGYYVEHKIVTKGDGVRAIQFSFMLDEEHEMDVPDAYKQYEDAKEAWAYAVAQDTLEDGHLASGVIAYKEKFPTLTWGGPVQL